eukprot:5131871-Alexandrium_andersonii.AAC.1
MGLHWARCALGLGPQARRSALHWPRTPAAVSRRLKRRDCLPCLIQASSPVAGWQTPMNHL